MRSPLSCTSTVLALLLGACAGGPPAHLATQATLPGGAVVAEWVIRPYDPQNAERTCKVYHHLWTPDGRQITKGEGGEFPHHRGLFVGWNQVTWRGAKYDFWHCHHGESQRFVGFVAPASVGLDDGWQVAAIDWCASDGAVVLHEQRAMRVTPLDATSYAVAWRGELHALADAVTLDGDPQHAGHQFRAVQAFAEPGATPVHYVRPATAKAHENDVWTGCWWTAAVLPFATGAVTVLRVEGAANPEPQWSTRGYGRFGAMWHAQLAPGTTLPLACTYVVALGERDSSWCEASATALRPR